jgi:hypothetical protein
MNPVMIHADGTACHHQGEPLASVYDDGGPACAAGIQVTHVRVGDRTLTMAEAEVAFLQLAVAWSEALRPFVDAFARWAEQATPAIRALAAGLSTATTKGRTPDG